MFKKFACITLALIFTVMTFFPVSLGTRVKAASLPYLSSEQPERLDTQQLMKSGLPVFFVSNSGDDNNPGTTPEKPWKTIEKVNGTIFEPNSTICFRRGDVWRETLNPWSGNESGYVTYTSYGDGEKPKFLGSINASFSGNWSRKYGDVWELDSSLTDMKEKPQESKTFDVKKLYYWQANGADAAFNQDGMNSFTVKCKSFGSKYDDLQIFFDGVDVKIGKTYVLQFRAKCSSSFVLPKICLMSKSGSWDDYTKSHVDCALKVSNEFNTYTVTYKAGTNDPKGKITFYIGGALPSGATLSVDSISLVEKDSVEAVDDIGNIIMNEGETVGKKKLSKVDLAEQNDFWYDAENNRLDVFSKVNPASLYKSIECAVTKDIINQSNRSYVIYDGLGLRYGGAHGIAGDSTHNIIIRNCDLSFIGGGLLNGERYGNGIEFWNDAHDNLVEGCRIWDVYDAALSNQGNGQDVKQYRLEYMNNTIWNCEYSFEVWNRGESSVMKDIFFEMNVCRDAGYGWGHSQRLTQGGYHLCFYRNSSNVSNLKIRSNAFIHGMGSIMFRSGEWNCFDSIVIEGNIISQEDKLPIAILDGITYNQDRFKQLQNAVEKGLGRIY